MKARTLLLLCLWIALGAAKAPPPPSLPPGMVQMTRAQQQLIGLTLATVRRQPIVRTLHVPGLVTFDPTRVAVLRPLIEARITRLLVQPGQVVAAGQPLAELAAAGIATQQAALASAQARQGAAAVGVAVARDALYRARVLAADGSMARAEVEQRRLQLAEAEAEAQALHAEVVALTVALTWLGAADMPGMASLVSPIAGVVSSVGVSAGEVVQPGMPGDAFTVADLTEVIIVGQVPQAQARDARPGQAALIRLPAGSSAAGAGWAGQVFAADAALNPGSGTVPVRIRLDNRQGVLRAGMFVDVTLFATDGVVGLVVPPDAVQMVGDRRVVFSPVGDGLFQSHDVTLGVHRTAWDEVRHGVFDGQPVVTKGGFQLKEALQKAMLSGGN